LGEVLVSVMLIAGLGRLLTILRRGPDPVKKPFALRELPWDALTRPPALLNEPVLAYEPHSPERACFDKRLDKRLDELAAEPADLPMGNVVIRKPAVAQQLAAHVTMQLLEEAGLPPGLINLVTGSGAAVSERALADPDLAGVPFTGSTVVFRSLWRRVAEHLDGFRTYPRLVGETGGRASCSPAGPPPTRRGIGRVPAPSGRSSCRGLTALPVLGGKAYLANNLQLGA
jgi:hypothetical protein